MEILWVSGVICTGAMVVGEAHLVAQLGGLAEIAIPAHITLGLGNGLTRRWPTVGEGLGPKEVSLHTMSLRSLSFWLYPQAAQSGSSNWRQAAW